MQKRTFNWEQAAGVVWPILVARAKTRRTIFYGEIAPTLNVHHRHVRLALGPIQVYCLDVRLPPLTALVISKANASPGTGFVGWDMDDLDRGRNEVFSFNWDKEENPFTNFKSGDTTTSLAKRLVSDPNNAEDVYATVRVRGLSQRIFRSALLDAYGSRCAICGLGFEEALQAAHIIPYAEAAPSQRMDPRNGILLCSSHHHIFDRRNLTINSKYKVVYADPEMTWGGYSESDKAMTINVVGQKITLPIDRRLWPSTDLLSKRNADDEWEAAALQE